MQKVLTVTEREKRNTDESIKLIEERGEILKQNLEIKNQLATAELKIAQKEDTIAQQEKKIIEKDDLIETITKQKADSNALNENTKQILHDSLQSVSTRDAEIIRLKKVIVSMEEKEAQSLVLLTQEHLKEELEDDKKNTEAEELRIQNDTLREKLKYDKQLFLTIQTASGEIQDRLRTVPKGCRSTRGSDSRT